MQSQSGRHPYYPHVDGLRAIAVIAVLLYHLNSSWLPGGFAGVDVFFVISGFVVSASVGERRWEGLASFATTFLSRRLRRIAPALVVCLLTTALIDAILIPDAWLSHRSQVTGRFAFFGFSNIVMARADNDYFSPIAELNPYTHTWSLGVEEQFYLIFPLLFFLWARSEGWKRTVAVATVVLSVASFAYADWLAPRNSTQAFYLMGSRFWELGVGVMLYQCRALRFGRGVFHPGVSSFVLRIGFALSLALVFAALINTDASHFPAPGAWKAVLGTVGIIAFARPGEDTFVALLSSKPFVAVGRISYSLYLWHWPVFVVFRWTVGLEGLTLQLLAIAIALLLAILSYRFIETPVRHSARLKAMKPTAVVALGLLLAFGGLGIMKQVTHAKPKLSISVVSRNKRDWYPDDARATDKASACRVVTHTQGLGKGYRETFARTQCDRPSSAPNVFAVGDSHAVAFGEMFNLYSRDTGAQVTLYNNGGCPFLSLQSWRDDTPQCAENSRLTLSEILTRIRPGDVVFLPSLRMTRYVDQWTQSPNGPGKDMVAGQAQAERLEASIHDGQKVVAQLHDAGARIVITAPNLLLHIPLYRCADSYSANNPICRAGSDVDRAAFEGSRAPMLHAVTVLAHSVPEARVWDVFAELCPQGPVCHGYVDGHPLFFDGDHLSGFANRLLLPAFEKAVTFDDTTRAAHGPA